MMTKRDARHNILYSPPLEAMVLFAVPIIAGNVFQQIYNIVDAVIIGRYLGDLSLAGITAVSPFIDVLNSLIIGGSIGIGVLMAQLSGANNMQKLNVVCANSILIGMCLSLFLTIIGYIAAAPILLMQGTDPEVFREALRYLHVILLGLIFCFFYNYYSSLLRSCGDSRIPFLILAFSCIVNVALDFLFTVSFSAGIKGVAWATTLSQLLSCILCAIVVRKTHPELHVPFSKLHFSKHIVKELFRFSWAGSLQRSSVRIGRLIIQGMLSSLGTTAVTGYNLGIRMETFIFCFSQGLSSSMATCVSQNVGNNDYKRIVRFYRDGIICEVCLAFVVGLVYLSASNEIMGIFTKNTEVVASGVQYLRWMAFIYILSFVNEAVQAFFRGMGRIPLTMISSIGQISIRAILSFFLIPHLGIPGICLAACLGWLIMLLSEGIYSIRISRSVKI